MFSSLSFYFYRNLLLASRSKGHEALCNRLHPNSLCTSKLIEFQSKRLNSVIAFLLNQQSTKRNDVQCTSTITKNQIDSNIKQRINSQKLQHLVTPLTSKRTIVVDAYYRFLCRERYTKLILIKHRPCTNEPLNGTPARLVTTTNNFTANWQSKQHQIANTNNRNNDANNERYIQLASNCYRNHFHSHLDNRSDSNGNSNSRSSKASYATKPHQRPNDSFRIETSLHRLQAIVLPAIHHIKSSDSTKCVASCVGDIHVSSPLSQTKTIDPHSIQSLIDSFRQTNVRTHRFLCQSSKAVNRTRICCKYSGHLPKQTIEKAIRLARLIKVETTVKRPVRTKQFIAFNAKNNMNSNAANANNANIQPNFQLACQANHCNSLFCEEFQRNAAQQHRAQTVNYNYCDENSLNRFAVNVNNNNNITSVDNNTSQREARPSTTFNNVNDLIDTFNGSLSLTNADNRKQLPQIILSDFSNSETVAASTSLLFNRHTLQTLTEHPIVIDTPSTISSSDLLSL